MEKTMYNSLNSYRWEDGAEVRNLCKTMGACMFIRMEYLVASALVELYENKRIDRISLDDVRNYGFQVEKVLNEGGGTQAILLYSNQYTKEFLQDYSDYFTFEDDFIKIKNGITIANIREHILSYVSIDILLALLDEKTLKTINAA